MNITWMLGIVLLMPGITANWIASLCKLPETYGAVLVADALLYSVLAAVPVYFITNKTEAKRTSLLRYAALLTVLTVTLVLGAWSGARTLDQRGHGLCENTIGTEIPSPDGKLKAVIFDRDCGATTATVVHISIVPREHIINHADVANTFSADGNHGASSLNSLFVEWKSDGAVAITYPAKARVFMHESLVGNVAVSYIAR
jgi:hypothetical protein